jgi:hypothetical protein
MKSEPERLRTFINALARPTAKKADLFFVKKELNKNIITPETARKLHNKCN